MLRSPFHERATSKLPHIYVHNLYTLPSYNLPFSSLSKRVRLSRKQLATAINNDILRKRQKGKKEKKEKRMGGEEMEGKRGIKSRIGERSKNSQKSRKSPRESHSTSVKRRKFISESLCPSVQTLLACPKPRGEAE